MRRWEFYCQSETKSTQLKWLQIRATNCLELHRFPTTEIQNYDHKVGIFILHIFVCSGTRKIQQAWKQKIAQKRVHLNSRENSTKFEVTVYSFIYCTQYTLLYHRTVLVAQCLHL